MKITDAVSVLRNVGLKRSKYLNALGIYTVWDLLNYTPRSYIDRTNLVAVAGLVPGIDASVFAVVESSPVFKPFGNSPRGVTSVVLRDANAASLGSGNVEACWFGTPFSFLRQSIRGGQAYVFTGRVGRGPGGKVQLISPEFEPAGAGLEPIVPIYPAVGGLGQRTLRGLIRQALEAFLPGIGGVGGCKSIAYEEFCGAVPQGIAAEIGLGDKAFAIANIHFPKDQKSFLKAREYLVFEELYAMQAALFYVKQGISQEKAGIVEAAPPGPAMDMFPFELTNAQLGVIEQLYKDMRSGNVANRLIQGDVGSGKTAVAMVAVYMALFAPGDFQAAVMAPTEVLAAQHYATFAPFFEKLGIESILLAGRQTPKERKEARQRIESGQARLVVGTNAIIQEGVVFRRLGLAISDEQHRFGVRQRLALSEKGRGCHTIVMSATPIPRTLALILFGDMDISTIDTLPPGRKPIKTYAVTTNFRPRLRKFIVRLVEEGRQVYVLCPRIEEKAEDLGEAPRYDDKTTVVEYAEELARDLPSLRVVCLHGRMETKDKAEAIRAFSAGEVDVLVCTTVVEVGMNVPNAALMIIEGAESFGLAQLHQLRGRVGRGEHQAYCVLVSDARGEVYESRAAAMTSTNDGFELARLDLELRGHGDFFGTAQHGMPQLRIANLYEDMPILSRAQEAARRTLAQDPDLAELQNARLLQEVRKALRGFTL